VIYLIKNTEEKKKIKLKEQLLEIHFYITPEVLKNEYNEKCHLWFCRAILYKLLCGSLQFYGKNEKDIF
jgi:calcium-dependent protein kinase